MKILTCGLLCLLSTFACAEDASILPNAPKPNLKPKTAIVDHVLMGVDVGMRWGDVVTTRQFMLSECHCNHEMNPIAPHTPGWGEQVAFQMGMAAVVYEGSSWLRRRGHRKLARVLIIADIASETWAVQNNARLK